MDGRKVDLGIWKRDSREDGKKAFLEERPVTVRRNTAVVSKEEFEKELEKDGVVYRRHPVLPYAYELTNYDYLAGLLAFQKGYIYIRISVPCRWPNGQNRKKEIM